MTASMDPSPRHHLDVVVGVDGSEPSRRALRWAATEARRTGGRLIPVLSWTYLERPADGFRTDFTADDASQVLERVIDETLGPDPDIEVRPEVVTDRAAKGLLDRAEGAGLLVVGDRGQGGFAGLRLGSVSTAVVTHATVPTVVIRGDSPAPRGKVVVGVDKVGAADSAVRWAAAHADRADATLVAVRAWMPPSTDLPAGFALPPEAQEAIGAANQDLLDACADELRAEGATRVETKLVVGLAAPALLEESADADLLVLAPRGRGPLASRLLGSVTYQVLNHAECPIAVVPPPPS